MLILKFATQFGCCKQVVCTIGIPSSALEMQSSANETAAVSIVVFNLLINALKCVMLLLRYG